MSRRWAMVTAVGALALACSPFSGDDNRAEGECDHPLPALHVYMDDISLVFDD